MSFCTHSIAQDVRGIAELAQGGAPGLALKLLDKVQPDPAENLDAWLFFERQRIDIMRDWQEWEALSERLRALPENVPPDFRYWANVEGINAYLNIGQGESARELLRPLIWKSPTALAVEEFSLYRRLIVRSYLVEDNLQDAQRAMRRYQQDYGNKGLEWRKLQVRILLNLDRAGEALKALADITTDDNEMRALRLLAELRGRKRLPKAVLADVQAAVMDKALKVEDTVRLWSVGAEAARDMGDRLAEIRILETALNLSVSLPADDGVFAVNGDHLWNAYRQYAQGEGNALQLLIGQDSRWLKEAARWQKQQPEKARSFLTVVMLDGTAAETRQQANKIFLQSIQKFSQPAQLLQKLYVGTRQFPVAAAIPDEVRYLLVDDALAKNDIALATRLMSGFETAPADSDPFEWGLRRARVLVLGGQHNEGNEILKKLIQNYPKLEKAVWDRILQVVFDLQTVGRHEDAIALFKIILQRPLEPQMQREILFWQADSYKAIGDQPRAAWLYLRSATLLDGAGHDPWGQTAKFQAAEVLVDAGVIEDARRIYEGLLQATQEPAQRAIVKYKLQELWLKAD